MYTLCCTQRLLSRLGGTAGATTETPEPTTVLGNWYANLLNVGRLRLVLCASERSLLPVLLPAKPLATLPERLSDGVTRLLQRLDVAPSQIAKEHREMQWHQVGRTASRRILGSMNDFAFLATIHIRDDGPMVNFDDIALTLSRAPCRPIAYQSPDRLTQKLFRNILEQAPAE